MNKEEQLWINECLQGNTEAFRKLVDAYRHFAYTLAMRITKNEEDAEEVTQDAFLKAYTSLQSYKGEAKFSTWFYKIVLNMAMTKVRRRKPAHQNIDEVHIAIANDDEPARKKDRTYYVEKAISTLPEDEASIVTLFYMEDQSLSDISEVLNLSLSNTKVKLFRARNKLAEVLKNELKENVFSLL
ncbi:MAG TPA: sigma-70 family RNA polymerase sigma factor [Bacteroidales bacterium]|nr:sigma-70 family RNA polymerase sigma factor [Bacteroidales bacterium]